MMIDQALTTSVVIVILFFAFAFFGAWFIIDRVVNKGWHIGSKLEQRERELMHERIDDSDREMPSRYSSRGNPEAPLTPEPQAESDPRSDDSPSAS